MKATGLAYLSCLFQVSNASTKVLDSQHDCHLMPFNFSPLPNETATPFFSSQYFYPPWNAYLWSLSPSSRESSGQELPGVSAGQECRLVPWCLPALRLSGAARAPMERACPLHLNQKFRETNRVSLAVQSLHLGQPGSKFWFCYLVAMWLWARYLISQGLDFLIWKMKMGIVPSSVPRIVRIQEDNAYKMLGRIASNTCSEQVLAVIIYC